MVSAIASRYVKPIYMASVAKLPHRLRSDSIVKRLPEGSFTTGRSQPPKVDRRFQPLKGITSKLDFGGAKIESPVVVVKDANGSFKIFKGKNVCVAQDDEVATVYETSEIDGAKTFKVIEVIPQGKELTGYYITTAGILVRPIKKVSIESRQAEIEIDPAKLELIALAFEKAGDQEKAQYFGDRYAQEVLSGKYEFENGDHLLVDGDDLTVTPLGLSDAINCHNGGRKKGQECAKRGSKGISTAQRRLVSNCCYLLEEKYGKDCLGLMTLTLPAFANFADLLLICSNWADLIRKFIQELKRILKRRGFPESMVWTTEIQEDRYRDSGTVAPHLHLIYVGKRHRYDKQWAISKVEVRSLWERILGNLLDRPITCQAATRVERPRKSLKAEMGKYMSKGGKVIRDIIDDGKGDQLPSNYGGATDNLRNAYKKRIVVYRGYEALKFIDNLETMKQAGLLFYKPIIIYAANLGKEITVGFVGWIKEKEIVSQFLAA